MISDLQAPLAVREFTAVEDKTWMSILAGAADLMIKTHDNKILDLGMSYGGRSHLAFSILAVIAKFYLPLVPLNCRELELAQ
jgi:hypothetical protein